MSLSTDVIHESYKNHGIRGASLIEEIKHRGYKQGWVKEKLDSEKTKEGIVALNRENVKVKMQEEKCRKNIPMTKSCYKEFDEFLKDKKNAYIYSTAALHLFVKMYKENWVDIEIDPC